MSEWMKRLIGKHTCHFCDKRLDKKEIYTINMETAEGPHTISSCEKCAMEFDEVLKQIEGVHNDKRI